MTHFLVYWKSYWEDIKEGYKPSGSWSTNSKAFHQAVRRGDILWAVISGGTEAPGTWNLIERIQVDYTEPNPSVTKWGKWHIIGDDKKSLKFSVKSQPDMTAILWMLQFASGTRITIKGQRLGQALQSHGFRRLADNDAVLLDAYAVTLKRKAKSIRG